MLSYNVPEHGSQHEQPVKNKLEKSLNGTRSWVKRSKSKQTFKWSILLSLSHVFEHLCFQYFFWKSPDSVGSMADLDLFSGKASQKGEAQNEGEAQ